MNNKNVLDEIRDCVKLDVDMNAIVSEEMEKKIYCCTDEAAQILLKKIGQEKYPISVDKIFKFFGIKVRESSFESIKEKDDKKIHALIKVTKNSDNADNINIELIINDDDNKKTTRKTALCALGLYIWGYNGEEKFFKGLSSNKKSKNNNIRNNIRVLTCIYNCFALNVLIPTQMIKKLDFYFWYEGIKLEARVELYSKIFNVSKSNIRKKLYMVKKYNLLESLYECM